MNDDIKNKPPYLPYTTFRNVVGNLNKNGVLPARIDKTVLAGQSGSMQSWIWASLRFLGLIDESKAPTDDLKRLVRAEGEERKGIWREIFDRSYAPLLGGLELPTATVGMLHDQFAAQGLSADTARKCHSFYAAAAEDAGIELPPQLRMNARGGSGASRKPRKRTTAAKAAGSGDQPDEFADGGNSGGGGFGGGSGEASQVATLLLDGEAKRSVKIKAPATITNAELDRIQKWLSFQLIVKDE